MLFRQIVNPFYVVGRLDLALWEKRHPDAPWMSQRAVRFLDSFLRKTDTGIEFGSGRSTIWFGRRVGRLVSVEHDAGWSTKVKEMIQDGGLIQIEHHHIHLDHPAAEPTRAYYDPLPRYVDFINRYPDNTFDFVVVDGHYRVACILASISKLKAGGILILDNSNWLATPEDWHIPSSFRVLHRSRNVKSETTIFLKTLPCFET
jgi:predicted O-methyltransferase YrrM